MADTPASRDAAALALAGAAAIAESVGRGEAGAAALVDAALAAIRRRDGEVNAFSAVWADWARERAAEVDAAVARGAVLALAGVPIGVKASEGIASVQARRLMAAGAVPVGATAVPGPGTDWKTWGATERGLTANPRRPGAGPGGSSAGSGAAVAAGMVPLATASDGAGSTRIPAAWCGVVGYKPTTGLLPARDPAGLTVGGPITRSVADVALYRRAVLGEASAGCACPAPVRRVEWSASLGFNRVDPEVAETAAGALGEWARRGGTAVREAGLDLADPAARWRARRAAPGGAAGVDPRTEARLAELFAESDLLATPTTPNPPHGPQGPGEAMSVGLTWLFNLTGHPAISLPAGVLADGSPVGLQLVAPRRGDETLIRAAADYERRVLGRISHAGAAPCSAPPGGRPIAGPLSDGP
ncbi:amidase [Streptomonospora sp. PA3]|uniref:amidase family protein n=1 Tax=Streptomonospora sp. PA3 TaxID=2607326 RepID=UPI0012DC2003|nr:amidase [Streptomonospora sp. PA3]MUL43807.1 amidase [Streptomonospora sp. PA3]